MIRTNHTVLAALAALVLSACTQGASEVRSTGQSAAVTRGQAIFAKECARCHSPAALGGAGPLAGPDLTGLAAANGGAFPREYVRSFVMGVSEIQQRGPIMPKFAKVGLRHVYPDGGADGEVLGGNFADLIDYLEAIQQER